MQLKVMTFNLLYAGAVNPAGSWSERLPLVLDVLRAGADVVALQEATALQLADIEREVKEFTVVRGPESGETRLPRILQHAGKLLRGRTVQREEAPPKHGAPRHPRGYRGEHCAILYRTDRFDVHEGNAFWISHEPQVAGSVLPGTWLPRVVNWVRLRERESARCVTIYNAHLDFLPWSPPRSARILRQMLDTHWDHTPQILMGDFNAHPNSAAYKHFGRDLKQGFHPCLMDAWLAAEQQEGPEGTYHGGTGRVRWIGRLDRILLRPSMKVQRVTTVTHHHDSVYPSDHYPVLAELQVEEDHPKPIASSHGTPRTITSSGCSPASPARSPASGRHRGSGPGR
jgi:endonuclease/exonuclease/phosphatase family metal-dependent hydrolase